MPLPPLDVEWAVAVGRRVVPPGPELSAERVAAVVAGLRAAAAASIGPVEQVTHLTLPPEADLDAAVVDRATWVEANARMATAMLTEATGEAPPAGTMLERGQARLNGAQLGGVLAVLGSRILGQYLPFTERPRLVLVAPNIAKIEDELGVNRDDFRLWVCLHERTHHLQFARAPWLRGHLAAQVAALLDESDAGGPRTRRNQRTTSLVDLVTTPDQRRVFDQVSAVMALLEGYADDMMDRVGPEVVPSVAVIRERFERRRRRGGVRKVLNRALGLDLKLAQYAEGAAFCRAVIERVGVDGLNVAYEGPELLPHPDEIREPTRWVARVHR